MFVCAGGGGQTGCPRQHIEAWRSAGVSTHATDPLTLTGLMTAGLIPQERSALRGKRCEEVRRHSKEHIFRFPASHSQTISNSYTF